jgi:amino acid permease
MVSAEAMRPRIYIKSAFKTVYIRLAIFFVGGSLCAGIVVAYNVSGDNAMAEFMLINGRIPHSLVL